MKMRSIRTGITEWAVILLTALLSYGGQNNHPQSYKAIHEAVEKGDLEEVKRLLEKGADVNAKDKDGWTPLLWAARLGNKEVVELLIAKGADVNAKGADGETPLHQAVAYGGHKEVAELLIAKSADVNAKNNSRETPLRKADNKDVAELLIAKGADVNAKGDDGITPLHWAAMKGHKDIVELLIAKGADVKAKDNNSWTPFSRAAMDGHKEVAELLIAKGADMNTKDNWGETPLYQAVENGHKEVVELSIAKGADVNAKCDDGATLLHMAAIKGNKDIIELLIAKGADVNAKDYKGQTPLRWAAKDVVELLIAKGADALPAPSAGPEEFAEKIPENLTAIAGDAFKKGYLYFIWCPKEGPFVFKKNSGMMKIPLYYAVNPAKKAEPFSTRLKLIAVDPNKEFQEITGTTNGDTEEGWWAYGIIVPDIYGLRGEGQASMFLIKKSEAEKKNAKPISNIAVVDVVLEKI